MQMFNMEDDMLKAVSEIMEMQKTLEGIQYDNRILKMQNELDVLKEKVHDFIVYSMHTTGEKETVKEYNTENKGIGGDFKFMTFILMNHIITHKLISPLILSYFDMPHLILHYWKINEMSTQMDYPHNQSF